MVKQNILILESCDRFDDAPNDSLRLEHFKISTKEAYDHHIIVYSEPDKTVIIKNLASHCGDTIEKYVRMTMLMANHIGPT